MLDARQFSLLNGIDQETRAAIRAAMGIGPEKLPVQWASSAVYAIVNTQRRGVARGAAGTYLAWDRVSEMVDVKADEDLTEKAKAEKAEARRNLETAVRRAYQHVIYLDEGDEASDEPRLERTITFEQENQTALDGTTVWKALVDAGKAFDIGTFSGKALLHNLRDGDYDRPLDEVRDLFWNAPRMPLLPNGDVDLQRAIYEAVAHGVLRLVGADDVERHVTSASEIGVGQSSVRLAIPISEETDGGEDGGGEESTGDGDSGEGKTKDDETPEQPITEKQIAFALRASLSADDSRDALYALLTTLADRVDERGVSYAEVMVKMRVAGPLADGIADLVRNTGTQADVRDV